jgi:hypothetical protein
MPMHRFSYASTRARPDTGPTRCGSLPSTATCKKEGNLAIHERRTASGHLSTSRRRRAFRIEHCEKVDFSNAVEPTRLSLSLTRW